MNITLFRLVVGLMATAGTAPADGSGQNGNVGLQARSSPAQSDPIDVRLPFGRSRTGETASFDDEEVESGQLMFGIMLSASNTRLFIKGDGSKQSPLRVYARIAPFTFINVNYWSSEPR